MGANITVAAFISLFVCLIPTTIGGLLSAIGIAGMDRALRANVITKSGKAIETAGDIDTLLLDKTGTITIGNRKATRFYPVDGFGCPGVCPAVRPLVGRPIRRPKANPSSSWVPSRASRPIPCNWSACGW